jgi:hypothetical protein
VVPPPRAHGPSPPVEAAAADVRELLARLQIGHTEATVLGGHEELRWLRRPAAAEVLCVGAEVEAGGRWGAR